MSELVGIILCGVVIWAWWSVHAEDPVQLLRAMCPHPPMYERCVSLYDQGREGEWVKFCDLCGHQEPCPPPFVE